MNILIAEDDDVSLALLCGMLETEPAYTVTGVSDGAAAWAQLGSQTEFDLGIFDVMMPEIDGLTLLGHVRRHPRLARMPVILCTALNDRATVIEAAALEINHYIVKPFSRAMVLEKVRLVAQLQHLAGVVEPIDVVCARLGLEVVAWRSLVDQLATSIQRWVSDAQKVFREQQLKSIVLRANALKGACVNLGAPALAEQFSAVEAGLNMRRFGEPKRP